MGKHFDVAQWRIEEWEKTYAPLNVAGEIEKMQLWLSANPKRARKKNWARFVINWLNKAHAQVVSAQVQARTQAKTGSYDGRKPADYSEECAAILERYPDLGQR